MSDLQMTPDEREYWRRAQMRYIMTQPMNPHLPPMMTLQEWEQVSRLAQESKDFEEFTRKFAKIT